MMSLRTWAVVPVKSLGDAKQRLVSVLPLEARRLLMLTMFQDVLAVLQGTSIFNELLVVTPDAHVAQLAESTGAVVLRAARDTGHSAAVSAGFAHARSHGATRALTIPGDAPLVTSAELDSILRSDEGDAGGGPRLTLVPSRDGDGTNALLVTPPDAFEPSFGPGSFARHLSQAYGRNLPCRVLRLPGLATDIDEPRDLLHLMQAKAADPRYAFLRATCGGVLERAGGS
jgi:2-phospho-L-lactate guanylyltransferase